MKNLFNKFTLSILVFGLLSFVGFGIAAPALAAPIDEVCKGVGLSDTGGCAGDSDLTKVAKVIINVMSWAVGIVAVIMIIIGGFSFVLSGGDSTKAAKARMTILYAVIGIVIVVFAQVIIRFVLTSLSSGSPAATPTT